MALAGGLILGRGNLAGLVLAVLGGCGVLMGLVMVFGRREAYLDRSRRTLVASSRVLVELHRREDSVADARELVLGNDVLRRRYGWSVFYNVAAVGPSGRVSIRSLGDAGEAERFGQTAAAFLGLPLSDQRRPFDALVAGRRLGGGARLRVVAVTLLALLLASLGAALYVASTRHAAQPAEPSPKGRHRDR